MRAVTEVYDRTQLVYRSDLGAVSKVFWVRGVEACRWNPWASGCQAWSQQYPCPVGALPRWMPVAGSHAAAEDVGDRDGEDDDFAGDENGENDRVAAAQQKQMISRLLEKQKPTRPNL